MLSSVSWFLIISWNEIKNILSIDRNLTVWPTSSYKNRRGSPTNVSAYFWLISDQKICYAKAKISAIHLTIFWSNWCYHFRRSPIRIVWNSIGFVGTHYHAGIIFGRTSVKHGSSPEPRRKYFARCTSKNQCAKECGRLSSCWSQTWTLLHAQ